MRQRHCRPRGQGSRHRAAIPFSQEHADHGLVLYDKDRGGRGIVTVRHGDGLAQGLLSSSQRRAVARAIAKLLVIPMLCEQELIGRSRSLGWIAGDCQVGRTCLNGRSRHCSFPIRRVAEGTVSPDAAICLRAHEWLLWRIGSARLAVGRTPPASRLTPAGQRWPTGSAFPCYCRSRARRTTAAAASIGSTRPKLAEAAARRYRSDR